MLKALCKLPPPQSVTLAGFDGFGQEINQSYYIDSLELSTDYKRLAQVNKAIAAKIPEFQKVLNLSFLTPSRYNAENQK